MLRKHHVLRPQLGLQVTILQRDILWLHGRLDPIQRRLLRTVLHCPKLRPQVAEPPQRLLLPLGDRKRLLWELLRERRVGSWRIRLLLLAVIIADGVKPFAGGGGRTHSDYSLFSGCAHLAAGLCCGLSGLAAGAAIGIVGDAGVRAVAQQRKVYVGMVLMLIFAEALGLYGLIVGLILAAKTSQDCGEGL